jgi:hypothetical protein
VNTKKVGLDLFSITRNNIGESNRLKGKSTSIARDEFRL